jgi:hypothetical protein
VGLRVEACSPAIGEILKDGAMCLPTHRADYQQATKVNTMVKAVKKPVEAPSDNRADLARFLSQKATFVRFAFWIVGVVGAV